MGVQMRYNQL